MPASTSVSSQIQLSTGQNEEILYYKMVHLYLRPECQIKHRIGAAKEIHVILCIIMTSLNTRFSYHTYVKVKLKIGLLNFQ